LAEAQELCDNIAFINDGKIIKQDSKKKLLAELGSRYLDVEFENAIDPIKVSSLKNTKLKLLNENKIRFDLHTENNDFTRILEIIHSMDLRIKNLNLSEPDLEDIFHKIVKK
jgi:ABC-2 type transport system ATP-binding protein